MDPYWVCPYHGSAALKWGTISLWFPPWGIRKDHKPTLSRKPQYRRLNFTRHKLIDRYCSVNFLLSWNMIIDCHNSRRPTHLRARGALWREAGSHSREPIHHIFHKVPLSPSITPSEGGGGGLSLEKKRHTSKATSCCIYNPFSLRLIKNNSVYTAFSWEEVLRGGEPRGCDELNSLCVLS